MSELSILLVEDDTSTCKRFIEYIDTQENIILVNVTNSSSQAISNISYYQPDAIILDLELHNGSGNGLEVLSALSSINLHPYVLVTTNNSSETTYECARQLGADFIMYKHQKDYSEKSVVDFLYSLKNIIKQKRLQDSDLISENPEQKNKRICRMISNELSAIGMNPKSTGYKYLVDAICIFIDEPITYVYSQIGKKYGKGDSSVQRAMENAIKRTWNSTDIDVLLNNYKCRLSPDRDCPTLTEFISYYAQKIKNLM